MVCIFKIALTTILKFVFIYNYKMEIWSVKLLK